MKFFISPRLKNRKNDLHPVNVLRDAHSVQDIDQLTRSESAKLDASTLAAWCFDGHLQPLEIEMSDEQRAEIAAQLEQAAIEEWASAALADMLGRVRSVCITEYRWMIDELQRP